jgi:putative hemolysin
MLALNQVAHEAEETFFINPQEIFNFKPKISILIETDKFILKTADAYEELLESFKLRHEVFFQELQGKINTGIDLDKFDAYFDHLVIIEKNTNNVIGTYRLNLSEFSNYSYTAQEFDLDEIFKIQGPHLELGRACIHKEFRNGIIISLLWRGIVAYMNQSGARVLFGCSSIKVNNPKDTALIYKYLLEQRHISESNFTSPTSSYQMPFFDIWISYYLCNKLTELQCKEAESLIPPLVKSYLKLGAKIASIPAYDKEFDCIDVLTVLKKEDITNSVARRFQMVQ